MVELNEGRNDMNALRAAVASGPETLPPPPPTLPHPCALFLDLDGTLAPFQATPCAVGPEARRQALLSRLAADLDGRVAVVSGRDLQDIDRILAGGVTPVAAVHGLVRRDARGRVSALPAHDGLGQARETLKALSRCERGLLFEDKTLSVALHYRNVPEAAEAVVEASERLARVTGLVLQLGDMVAELRTPGCDKGQAVAAFLQEQPFAGTTPVFVGDDLTDEDGFAAATRLGGFGVLVGPPRPTLARYRLEDVESVLAWLEGAAPRTAG